ncbi:MAG TPA: ATP-binding protein [Terriglobales bacterium]|jgi:signal transduction histidine kinase
MRLWRRSHAAAGVAARAAADAQTDSEGLRQSTARLGAVLESVDAAVLAVDAEQRRWYSNSAANRLLPSLPRLPQLVQWMESVASSGEPWNSRLEMPDGRTLEVHITPLGGAGGGGAVSGCVVVARDITDRVHLETARRDFIAGISHELRTPLTSIQGYAEMLRGSPEPEAEVRAEYLDIIVRNTARLTRLARDLVTLSSLETRTYPFHFEPVEAASLGAPALDVVAPLARERGCRLALGTLGSGWLRADREALHRVLLNLLENALVHGGGGPGVAVELSGEIEGGAYVYRVRDTGAGISSSDQPRVFERFYRVDRSHASTAGGHGSGLGLALVKHIVREHGGEVELASSLGAGTTVTVRLPLAPE